MVLKLNCAAVEGALNRNIYHKKRLILIILFTEQLGLQCSAIEIFKIKTRFATIRRRLHLINSHDVC